MESTYHIVAIRVNETSWTHVWRHRSHYLGTGCDKLPVEELEAKEDLSYQEYPIKILETSEMVTQNKKIKMCKVQWSHHTEEEATWEWEEELKAEFPSFFFDPSESQV
jgi:hypothetical protein